MRNNYLTQKGIIFLVLALLLLYKTAFAEWKLIQNSPTTNNLRSVYFLDDNTGWIAGDNSSIYKTTNSGESWVQQTSPEASNFQCIAFVDANIGWACGTGGTVIKTTNGGTNWISQTFTASKLSSMDFMDANSGYIAGDFGNIYKTTDGGSSWIIQLTGLSWNLHQIKFEDEYTTGFAAGDNAIIFKTTDGGLHWWQMTTPAIASQIFYSIGDEFSLDDKIFATGTVTKYSTDQGESWNLGEFPAEPIFSLTALGDYRYVGVGGNGYIVKTADEGITWTIEQSPTAQNLYSVNCLQTSNFMWAVGANGTVLKYIPDWSYTFASGDAYRGVHFINQNTGWVVGQSGKIAKTTDSGTTWSTQNSGTSQILSSVYFSDASTGYTAGSQGTILKTTNGGTNWNPLSSATAEWLYSVYFIDANTGYSVGGNGTIMKTTNSGTNWIQQSSGTTYTLKDVFFADANNGIAVGGYAGLGIILRTTNSGTTWTTQNSGTINFLSSVYFIDANTGYTVGDSGTIFKTTNGGANWDALSSGTNEDLRSVYFIDANVGYIVSEHSIYKTNNGGSNWFEDEVPGGLWGMNEVQIVFENNTAIGFGAGYGILRTSFEYLGGDPTGSSGNYPGWVQVNGGTTTGFLTGVDYINPFVAYAVGGPNDGGTEMALILRTINGGQTWTRQQSNVTTYYLYDVSFADVNNGIAVGGFVSGIIRKTTNGGADWIEQTSNPLYALYSVDMLDINNAFACGFQGLMLHTSDGGTNWQTQTTGISGVSWNSVDYINSTTATAVGSPGKIIRTTDAGLNWVAQTGGRNLDFRGVEFIDVNYGIAIASEGPVLRTTNGGTDWVQVDSLNGYPSAISYINFNNAFIISQFGGISWIYRSTNGGLTWILQTTDNASYLSVSFTDENNGLITGIEGLILRTSNGGVISETNTAYNRNGLNLPIGDFQNTDDSINVNITDNLSAYAVTRVYLTIDTVLHTNDADLEFFLGHNGITDTLIYQNGGSGDNFLGTFLNDETNFPLVSGEAPFRGSYEPYRPLSKFNGQDPDGYWNLRIYDRAAGSTGTLEAWSLTLLYQSLTGVPEDHKIPTTYLLSQNFPNPFNPSTMIRYHLPERLLVTIKIFNILGQEVVTLINEEKPAGSYEVNFNASKLSSGVYFYRLQAGNFISTKKMILLK